MGLPHMTADPERGWASFAREPETARAIVEPPQSELG
jgi:hypothetical protein